MEGRSVLVVRRDELDRVDVASDTADTSDPELVQPRPGGLVDVDDDAELLGERDDTQQLAAVVGAGGDDPLLQVAVPAAMRKRLDDGAQRVVVGGGEVDQPAVGAECSATDARCRSWSPRV